MNEIDHASKRFLRQTQEYKHHIFFPMHTRRTYKYVNMKLEYLCCENRMKGSIEEEWNQ